MRRVITPAYFTYYLCAGDRVALGNQDEFFEAMTAVIVIAPAKKDGSWDVHKALMRKVRQRKMRRHWRAL